MKKETRIKSAEQAQRHSVALEKIWSEESRLTQRTLIYIAELLEDIRRQTKTRKGKGAKLRSFKN